MKENLLLAVLPRKERERLDQHLEHVTLDQGEVLIEPEEPIKHVLFPYDLVTSTIQGMPDGTQLEVGLMGVEGMIGIQFWLYQKTTPTRTVVQVPGSGLRMKTSVFKREVMEKSSPLNELVASYTHAFLVMTSQVAVCNRLHQMDERLSRWLMLIYNRTQRKEFPLTQEFLAMMLGAHRPTVSTAASILQKAGFIRYSRGIIKILDPKGLEQGSCECLSIMEAQFDKIFDQSWIELARKQDQEN
jgi:CRP-like cAMP-binding protein